MEQLKSFFNDKSIAKILDIGTGAGDFIKVLDDTFGDSVSIIGTDPGEEWLKEAREHFPKEHIQFKRMEGEQLDFEDNSFDVVAISNALHHLKDIEKSFSEMRRVLKPGGWVIINEISDGDLNEAQENQKMLHHFKSFVDRLHGISHRETWTQAGILEVIKENGVDVQLSFPHEKMKTVNKDELFLEEKYLMMGKILEELQGRPEHKEMAEKLPIFRERLNKYGFQMATQLMTVGQFQ